MTNYYIYHVPGIKIGVTTNVPRRMRDQGFTEWEHLETHTDIYEVSDRERELQAEYGYPIDMCPYYHTANMANPSKAGKASAEKTRTINMETARMIRASELSIRKAAKHFGVTRSVVWKIRNNVTYKDE